MTNSPACESMSVEYRDCSRATPTSGGLDDNGVCQDIGITFDCPRQVEVTKATTPPDNNRFAKIVSMACRSSLGALDKGDPKVDSLINTLLHAINHHV